MRKRLILTLGLIILMIGSTVLAQHLPNLTITSLAGEKTPIYNYLEDGPILINFWSLSCAPCKREMKYLDEFAQTYADSGFHIISINIDTPRSMSKVRSYVRSNKYAFPVFKDPRNEVFRKLGGRVMPYTIFVLSDGTIKEKHVGYAPGDEKQYRQSIEAMLSSTD